MLTWRTPGIERAMRAGAGVRLALSILACCVAASTRAAEWTPGERFLPRSGHGAFVLNGRMWVAGGQGDVTRTSKNLFSDAWSTADGLDWRLETNRLGFFSRADAQSYSSVGYAVLGDSAYALRYQAPLVADGGANEIWRSGDGLAWSRQPAAAPFSKRTKCMFLEFNGRLWVIGGSAPVDNITSNEFNDAWSSSDGTSWTQACASLPFRPLAALACGGRLWAFARRTDYFEDPVEVWSSLDGASWQKELASTPFHLHRNSLYFVFGGKLWVIGAADRFNYYQNEIWSSADGTNWTRAEQPAPFRQCEGRACCVFFGKLWLLGGKVGGDGNNYSLYNLSSVNEVWSSPDGVNWTAEGAPSLPPTRSGHASAVFRDKLWVIGGDRWYRGGRSWGDIWSTRDGRQWSLVSGRAPFGERANLGCVVFNDRLWVIGGVDSGQTYNHDVWSSADGINWTSATMNAGFDKRCGHLCLSYNGKLWVIGGYEHHSSGVFNDVWSSDNGTTWTQVTAAAFPGRGRGFHAGAVFGGRMWVFGGETSNGFAWLYLNDAWWSTDGKTWTKAADGDSSFAVCERMRAEVFNNEIWLVGGRAISGAPAFDAWRSADGVHWSRVLPSTPQPARQGHAVAVFGGKLWVTGGELVPPRRVSYNEIILATNTMLASADGVNWSDPVGDYPQPQLSGASCASFGGRLWMFGSLDQDGHAAWSSADGRRWRLETSLSPASQCVVFKDRLWTGNGSPGDPIQSSADGVTWTLAGDGKPFNSLSPDGSFYPGRLLAHRDKLWVLGWNNLDAEVYRSDDGSTWTRVALANPPQPARGFFKMASFAGRIWIIGGVNYDSSSGVETPLSDIWCSSDGAAWRRAWLEPFGKGAAILDAFANEQGLWVMTTAESGFMTERTLWRTWDCETWVKEATFGPFVPGSTYSGLTLNGKTWLLGRAGQGDAWSFERIFSAAPSWRRYDR